jgi:hypothetical protein
MARRGTITLRISEREENDWVIAHITTEDSEFSIAGLNANLRAQPHVYAAWEQLLQAVVDDFAMFHGLTEVISDTRTPISPKGNA